MNVDLFTAMTGTVSITLGAASASVALPTMPAPVERSVRVVNNSAQTAYIWFGVGSATAVITSGTEANGIPVLGGTTAGFAINQSITHIAAIASGVDGTLLVTVGQGV
jgi:hypothetical protein